MSAAITGSATGLMGTGYLARVDRDKRRLQRTVRPNVPLTPLQSARIEAAAEEAVMPPGEWIERSALASIGATGLAGVRGGPEAFARERAAWLAGVQAMREVQLDVGLLGGGGARAAAASVLLALCERGLADATARGRAAPRTIGRQVRAMGITPLEGGGRGVRGAPRNSARLRVGLTSSEGVLVDAAARASGASTGLYLAAAADASAVLLQPERMRRQRLAVRAAVRHLEQERDWWAVAAGRLLEVGALPAGWPLCPAPAGLGEAETALIEAMRRARSRWGWLVG